MRTKCKDKDKNNFMKFVCKKVVDKMYYIKWNKKKR